jgi:hypothetical protein
LPRPTRRSAVIVLAKAEDPEEEEEVDVGNKSTFVLPTYLAPPDLTADELTSLTQKNTKKNKLHFNKLNVETIMMDAMRPPSPTSKIRKSLTPASGVVMKESREERANKRRGALRSSTDGSEIVRITSELEDERTSSAVMDQIVVEELLNHFRAAGDEEEYRSPVRPVVRKGKKKSSVSNTGEKRRVKWDKALVYEGSLENEDEASGDGILKVSLFSLSSFFFRYWWVLLLLNLNRDSHLILLVILWRRIQDTLNLHSFQ